MQKELPLQAIAHIAELWLLHLQDVHTRYEDYATSKQQMIRWKHVKIMNVTWGSAESDVIMEDK